MLYWIIYNELLGNKYIEYIIPMGYIYIPLAAIGLILIIVEITTDISKRGV